MSVAACYDSQKQHNKQARIEEKIAAAVEENRKFAIFWKLRETLMGNMDFCFCCSNYNDCARSAKLIN